MKKTFCKSFLKFSAIGGILVSLLAFYQVTPAQESEQAERDPIKPASAERFVRSSELMIPSRSVRETCNYPNYDPICPTLYTLDVRPAHFLTLYNSDGSVWYQFSVDPRDPRYYLGSPKLQYWPRGTELGVLKYYPDGLAKSEFKPLGPEVFEYHNKTLSHPDLVILRLARESPNWYEVEINEKTRETKFILKKDPLWAKVGWAGIFNMSFNVVIDPERTKILDKPDGKPITGCTDENRGQHTFGKLEGDWMLVNGSELNKKFNDMSCMGWIRWRTGRNILVGSILTGRKIPVVRTAETETH